jgi:hypothetical protein
MRFESDAGKPLNGRSSIILGPPHATACDNSKDFSRRHPAFVVRTCYSDRSGTTRIFIERNNHVNTKKSIKAINLEPNPIKTVQFSKVLLVIERKQPIILGITRRGCFGCPVSMSELAGCGMSRAIAHH